MKRKLTVLAVMPLLFGVTACAESKPNPEAKQATAICGGDEGVFSIEVSSPNVKAKCDTVAHAEQAVREKKEEGEAAVGLVQAKEVAEAVAHKEAEEIAEAYAEP